MVRLKGGEESLSEMEIKEIGRINEQWKQQIRVMHEKIELIEKEVVAQQHIMK